MCRKFPLIYARRGKNISKDAEICEMHKRYPGTTKKKKNTQNIWKFLIFHEIIKNINNVGSIFMFIPKT